MRSFWWCLSGLYNTLAIQCLQPMASDSLRPDEATRVMWERARQLKSEDATPYVKVNNSNKGGLAVQFGPLRGFVPFSQLDVVRTFIFLCCHAHVFTHIGEALHRTGKLCAQLGVPPLLCVKTPSPLNSAHVHDRSV